MGSVVAYSDEVKSAALGVPESVLAAHGYAEGTETAAASLIGIRMTAAVYPAACIALSVLALMRYPIDKELNIRIGRELAERRERYAPAA